MCRDGRVRVSSLLSFEYPEEELGHRGSLVDEGSYVAFQFGQTEGLCQGVCRSLLEGCNEQCRTELYIEKTVPQYRRYQEVPLFHQCASAGLLISIRRCGLTGRRRA